MRYGARLAFAGAGFSLLVSQVLVFAHGRNAYYDCDARPGPEGARLFEAGPAGYEIVQLPIAGVTCRWHAVDGGLLETFHPDITLTVFTLGTMHLAIAGVVGLLVAGVRRRRAVERSEGGVFA